jgi:hypothetical protein
MSPIERICEKEQAWDDAGVSLAAPAIHAFRETRSVVGESIQTLGNFEGANGVIFHTLQNLLGRIEEQTEGMLVCLSTGCCAAAETIARTVVETSINFIYILRGHRANRIFSYFRIYLREHGKRLDEWSAFVTNEQSGEAARIIQEMISGRREGLSSLRAFAEQIAVECGFPDEPDSYDWNAKLFERFKATGHSASYWTVYHRLSASTHGNAEDTIRWLLGLFHRLERQDDEPLLKLASETVNYTAMMVRIAVRYYIEASIHVCIIYDLFEATKKLQKLFEDIAHSILALSDAAGAPKHD